MDARERTVVAAFSLVYCIAFVLVAVFIPSEREVSPLLIAGLLIGHAAVSQVRFEFGMGFVVPEQLVIVPMLLLLPLPYVPWLIAAAGAIGLIPDFIKGSWAKDRWLKPIADSGPYVAPVLVLAALAPGPPELSSAPGLCPRDRCPRRHGLRPDGPTQPAPRPRSIHGAGARLLGGDAR